MPARTGDPRAWWMHRRSSAERNGAWPNSYRPTCSCRRRIAPAPRLVGHLAPKSRSPSISALDFRTVVARRAARRREVTLNQRLAPDVYRGVAARAAGPTRRAGWLPCSECADGPTPVELDQGWRRRAWPSAADGAMAGSRARRKPATRRDRPRGIAGAAAHSPRARSVGCPYFRPALPHTATLLSSPSGAEWHHDL